MLIKQLVLHNFRVFNGTHTVDLAPRKRTHEVHDRPIVLFGGLNGAGKTSILTAIRFALYGRLAFNNVSQNKDYIAQLDSLIHNGSNADEQPEDALVELTFIYNKNGTESEFTVTRNWTRGKKDKLTLQQNGNKLKEMNDDQCQGFLNELIPHGVADLFFFDGEKISELAEDESGNILRTAVRRLLGLDLISKLKNDLVIFIKRQQTDLLAGTQKTQLSELENQISYFENMAEKNLANADIAKTNIELITSDIKKLEGQLSVQGGAFARTRAKEEMRVEELLKEKERLEKTIRQELDGSLPFAFAPNTLQILLDKLSAESKAKQVQSFEKELINFLDLLKQDLSFRSKETLKIATEAITDNLEKFRVNKPHTNIIFDLSEREMGMLQQAINQQSSGAWERFNVSRIDLVNIEEQLEQASANIARAPEDEQLAGLFQRIRSLDEKRISYRQEYKSLLEDAKNAKQKQLDIARQIQKFHDVAKSTYGLSSSLHNAHESVELLEYYTDVLTSARVKTLEKNFDIAYHKLARKEDLQLCAHINPDTFDVELVDENHISINRKSLSAGEKQIYAIAILEALARTSGRDLPVIIDTPLGRLDSKHRDKLINHYFPYASHQVVLLSTDTEVDEKYFVDQLRDDISHAYQIKFDAKSKSSILKPGYFWELTKETL